MICIGCLQWTSRTQWSSLNGVKYAQYNTPISCQNYCISLPSCVAVDFNSQDNSCWVHTSSGDLTPENSYPQPGVTQYQLSRVCTSTTTVGEQPTNQLNIICASANSIGNNNSINDSTSPASYAMFTFIGSSCPLRV